MRFGIVVLALACLLAWPAEAQDAADGERVRILLTDGTAVTGTLISQTQEEVRLRTDAGVSMNIPLDSIRRMEALTDSRFQYRDPNISRLMFAPTARPVPQGSGYVAIYEVFFPFVGYGLTEWGTISGGISLIPFSSEQLIYIAPKVTVHQHDRTSIAGGLIAATSVGTADDSDIPVFGMVFGLLTQGTAERSITLGAALGYADGQFAKNPALLFGGEYQVSNRIKLLTENYFIGGVDDGGLLLGGGIRFFGEHLAADFGLVTSPQLLGQGLFPFLPWLGFAYNFGGLR